MKVSNRSIGNVVYSIPEMNVRRLFNFRTDTLQGETKEIDEKELEALWQLGGGEDLIKHYLLIDDQDWVKKHWINAPIEYFWTKTEIEKAIKEDSVELLAETLDYAPEGVIDLIKELSWRIPLTDLNKISVLKEHPRTNFDVQLVVAHMKSTKGLNDELIDSTAQRQRLRRLTQ